MPCFFHVLKAQGIVSQAAWGAGVSDSWVCWQLWLPDVTPPTETLASVEFRMLVLAKMQTVL